MKSRAAVLTRATDPGEPIDYEIVEVEYDEPRRGELLVKVAASGLCHSDDHPAKGDAHMGKYPFIGGHEGAGVVAAVGPDTAGFEVGDHVIFQVVPSCGRCRWCATGQSHLCDLNGMVALGSRPTDPTTFRARLADGTEVAQMCAVGTFAEYSVTGVESVVKIDKDVPLDVVCLLGCAIGTGWGSAVHTAEVRPGQTVIVMGVGGIGISAVQGAAHAGALRVIAVDPAPGKAERAREFGATHAFTSIEDAADYARSVTNGQGADATVVTIGVVTSEHVAEAFASIRKAGRVVVTGLGPSAMGIPVSLAELTLYHKEIRGAVFGGTNARWEILNQIEMYREGRLKLDEMITRRYALDDIAQGYRDMLEGRNIRGVVVFDR